MRLQRDCVSLSVRMDVYTRAIRGWEQSRHLDQALTLAALERGLVSGRQPSVHHSDQGVHYAATASVARLEQLGTRISMAEQGEPRQNGYAERLMRTIKEEEVALTEYRDFADAYAQIGHFLDDVYQRKRIHSALGYLTPAEFEAAYHARLLTPVVIPYKRALQCPGLRAQFNRQLPHRDLSINTGVTSMQQIADTSPHALDQAVAYWQQQRYQVAYHDDYLAQLVRREMPDKILAVTALAALITLGAIIVVRLKKRPWHIVLLAEKDFSPPQAAGFQPRRLGASRL